MHYANSKQNQWRNVNLLQLSCGLCFPLGLDDSLKAEGQISFIPQIPHLGKRAVHIICPKPTYTF
jgi:hypothetical protein